MKYLYTKTLFMALIIYILSGCTTLSTQSNRLSTWSTDVDAVVDQLRQEIPEALITTIAIHFRDSSTASRYDVTVETLETSDYGSIWRYASDNALATLNKQGSTTYHQNDIPSTFIDPTLLIAAPDQILTQVLAVLGLTYEQAFADSYIVSMFMSDELAVPAVIDQPNSVWAVDVHQSGSERTDRFWVDAQTGEILLHEQA